MAAIAEISSLQEWEEEWKVLEEETQKFKVIAMLLFRGNCIQLIWHCGYHDVIIAAPAKILNDRNDLRA